MIVTVRKFLLFIIIAVILNLVVHIFYLVYPLYDSNKRHKIHKKPQYKHGRDTVEDWKLLHDMIICNHSASRTVSLCVDYREEISQIHPNNSSDRKAEPLKMCPLSPPGLARVANCHVGTIKESSRLMERQQAHRLPDGPVAKDKNILKLHGIDDMYLRIENGGVHIPADCIPQQRVALVVAVHETNVTVWRHIGSFIYYMHPFLMKQQMEYQIFVVVKKYTTNPYERGKLFNIGYIEAQTFRGEGWDCFIFHDAHLLPLDTRNIYRCSKRPRRLIADFRRPYRFGGAVSIEPRDFALVNGFSNLVWSKDGDYINMYRRLAAANYSIESNLAPIGNYTTFHSLLQFNTESVRNESLTPNFNKDGLTSILYRINELQLRQFYTLIEVEAEEEHDIISMFPTNDK